MKAILAVGGSVNCVKHLQATAAEAGLAVDIYAMFERFADEVPVLSALRPVGDRLIEEFEQKPAPDGTRDARGVVSRKKQLLPAVLGLLEK